MIPEQKITNFLENFNKNDKIHMRTYNMFRDAYNNPKYIEEMVSFLVKSGINRENLECLLQEEKEESEKQTAFTGSSGIYFDQETPTDLPEKRKEESISADIKKLKIEEPDSKEEIPGLFFEEVGLDSPKEAEVEEDNKNIQNDTVFYQYVLPDCKVKDIKDLSINKEPCYLFPVLQCKLCGLRFGKEHSERFGQHIEDHRRFTNALGEKTVLRREYFNSKPMSKIEKLDLTVEGAVEEVVWEKNSPVCSVCKKIIKKKWDDKLENWVLDDGRMINEREVAHRKCVF